MSVSEELVDVFKFEALVPHVGLNFLACLRGAVTTPQR